MKHKKIFATTIFLLIGLIIFYILNIVFLPEWVINKDATLSIRGIYEEKKNSLDVVFVGSSNVYNGISPLEIWEDYGISSYSYASPEQKIWLSYYAIEEVLTYQKPKIIMLEMNQAFTDKNIDEDMIRKLLDNMRIGSAKINAVNDELLNYSFSDKMSFFVPLLRYHTRWDGLNKSDFKRLFYDYDSTYKGYSFSKRSEPFEGNINYMEYKDETVEIDKTSLEYLDKIIKLCEENDVKLVLMALPTPHTWSNAKHEATQKYAKEKNLNFLELNYTEDTKIDWSTDTQDEGWHLNVNGASKIGKYIGSFLIENYQLTDHRDDKNYSDWNEDLKIYLQEKEN